MVFFLKVYKWQTQCSLQYAWSQGEIPSCLLFQANTLTEQYHEAVR